MYIERLIIRNFRIFDSKETTIFLDKNLSGIIGHNSSGKTVVLEALRKLFGSSTERNITDRDFHNSEDSGQVRENKEFSIEAILRFHKSEQDNDKVIPSFWESMVIDEPGGEPYLRFKLEAKCTYLENMSEGEIDDNYFVIKAPLGETVSDEHKKRLPVRVRSLIQIFYIPAIRKPSEQLKSIASGLLGQILSLITWEDTTLDNIASKSKGLTSELLKHKEFSKIQDILLETWGKYNKDSRYQQSNINFNADDIDSILKKLEIEFRPTEINRPYNVSELGEGYRSLFYLTLVCTLLKARKEIIKKGTIPVCLTILAIEEPENHIGPQLLGKVITNLLKQSEDDDTQVILTSHSPAIVKRIDPEAICHLRVKDSSTVASRIIIPKDNIEAYQYVKQAIQRYPEMYFAKLVVIGEGDSEEIVLRRYATAYDIDFDNEYITFAPLSHRFVNYIWKALIELDIPYVTLLDFDRERNGGDWGRVKYILTQLIANGKPKDVVLKANVRLTDSAFEKMGTWDPSGLRVQKCWLYHLEDFDVFYSYPLDLDFLMLEYMKEYYIQTIPQRCGPNIPKKEDAKKYNEYIRKAIKATLKSEDSTGFTYTDEEKELMAYYRYFFLGKGKPITHSLALNLIKDNDVLKANVPPVLKRFFDNVKRKLNQ